MANIYAGSYPENYNPEAGAETQWCPTAIMECSAVGIGGNFNRGGIGHIVQQTFDLTFSQSRINRALQFHKVGDTFSPDTGLNVSPASYPTMSYEWVRDNIPEHPNTAPTSDEDSVALFGVMFQKDDDPTSRLLVIRANRSAVKSGMIDPRDPTARFNLYTINFLPFMRIYQSVEEGIYTESRLSNNGALTCDVYEGTQVRMECFDQRFITENGEITDANDNVVETSFFIGLSSWVKATLPNAGDTGRTWYALWCPEQESFAEYFGNGGAYGIGQNINFGLNSVPGGYGYDGDGGSFDFRSDYIGLPDIPQYNLTSPGYLTAYKVTPSILSDLAVTLFPEPIIRDHTGDNVADVLNELLGMIDKLGMIWYNSKVWDFIVDCHIIPVPVVTTSSKRLTLGGKEVRHIDGESYYELPTVDNSYVKISCGAVSIAEAFGNFLDYMTRCKLYLPFYGYVDIPPEFWNGGVLFVDYTFNILDGSFVASVRATSKHSNLSGSLIGQYCGSAIVHIPVRGADYSTLLSGIAQTAVAVGSTGMGTFGALSGESAKKYIAKSFVEAGTEADAIRDLEERAFESDKQAKIGSVLKSSAIQAGSQLASGLGNVLSSKPGVIGGGNTNSSSALMMYRIPYLIIEYPTPQFSERYPKEVGLPLNVTASLGSYGGLTIAENPVLDGIPATLEEKSRITEALLSGLIFR